jgi:cobaltochelatase CobN
MKIFRFLNRKIAAVSKRRLVFRTLTLALLLIVGLLVYRFYVRSFAPTRVAFVNYPEFSLARIEKSIPSSFFIRVDNLSLSELRKARSYPAVFVFSRGLQLSPEQLQELQNAGFAGTSIVMEGATNPNQDVTNLKGRDLDAISDYLRFGGNRNYRSMLAYVRKEIDRKRFFVPEPESPFEIPQDTFFHLEEEAIFRDYDGFTDYVRRKSLFKSSAPTVALLTSVPGPFNANREHVDAFIQELTKRDLNVVPIAAATKRLEFLQRVEPDLVISMPHGRLTLGQAAEAEAWLRAQNIPMLVPVSVFQEYDKWLKDKQGFVGALASMSVALPEIDGGIVPYAVIAQYRNAEGLLEFRAIPDRMARYCDAVKQWLNLKKIANSKKKIAIYYFKGPGNNALTASNLEIVPSLYNLLRRMQGEGYWMEGLPDTEQAFQDLLMKRGPVLGPYAKGAFDEFVKSGLPALVRSREYESWVMQDLPEESYADVVAKYGQAPGEYMGLTRDGESYIAVARLQFGNIVLLPQPLPAVGGDTFQLVHGAKVAPAHPYIASYLWTRHAFKADAILHFGTHGSLEFTPGKQMAQSDYDWSDALIGTTPHFYVYTISNVGEAIIAKRRSYTTTLSHLTPAFTESELYGDLKQLQDKFQAYQNAAGEVRREYAVSIIALADRIGLTKDLKLRLSRPEDLEGESLSRLENYLEEIAAEKITAGLYILGGGYGETKTETTVTLMAIDRVAEGMADLDLIAKRLTARQREDRKLFDLRYRQPAKAIINNVLKGQVSVEAALTQVIGRENLDFASAWVKASRRPSEDEIVRGFIGMAGARGGAQAAGTGAEGGSASPAEVEELRQLVARILPDNKKREFIEGLRSEQQFRMSSGLLDPATLERARTVARAIPRMAEAIDIGLQPDVNRLLRLMQREPLRRQTFDLLDDKDLLTRVEAEMERRRVEIRRACLTQEKLATLNLVKGRVGADLPENISVLRGIVDQLKFIDEHYETCDNLRSVSRQEIGQALAQVSRQIVSLEDRNRERARVIIAARASIENITRSRDLLLRSGPAELDAVVNGLNGGFIAPSSGGDPVVNPLTIPTGRNLYSIDAEKTPSVEAWRVGKQLADALLLQHLKTHQRYPRKVAVTLWPSDFIETEGALVAEVLYLLGVEPVRDPFGRVLDLRVTPQAELRRPRIDVVVQTAGQFRDLAASRLALINKAVRMVAALKEEGSDQNHVRSGTEQAEEALKEKGLSPIEAREISTQRVFGGVNGNYGTQIMGMVESGDRWEKEEEVAQTYLNNMGELYDEGEGWGRFRAGAFEVMLRDTEAVIQPRESNTWGPLSLDHVYEFMGGVNIAVRYVTGKDPDAYFNDFRNPGQARVQEVKEAIGVEARTTLLNPKYVAEYVKGGASSAEKFAETFRNTYGWEVMKPDAIEDQLWADLHEVYVKDQLNLGIKEWFRRENPAALQEMTAVMLETVRKGYWKASAEQVAEIAQLHVELIKDTKPGCSGFVCDNQKLQGFISEKLGREDQQSYQAAIAQVRVGEGQPNAVVLEKEKMDQRPALSPVRNLFRSGRVVVVSTIVVLLILVAIFVWWRRRES